MRKDYYLQGLKMFCNFALSNNNANVAQRTYEPKKLQREKVKEVSLSFRRNLQESVGRECAESGSTIFGYV